MSDELAGCPFCGSEPTVHEPDFRGDRYQIACPVCCADDCDVGAVWTNGATFEEASERWNRRSRESDERPEDPISAAIAFAAEAHAGQIYRGYGDWPDEPYIFHVLRVAQRVTTECQVVAWLHDCLEDAGKLPRWLSSEERSAIDLLTRDKSAESYEAYVARIADAEDTAGQIARAVKRADLLDNLEHDPPRRLAMRYVAAIGVVNGWTETKFCERTGWLVHPERTEVFRYPCDSCGGYHASEFSRETLA